MIRRNPVLSLFNFSFDRFISLEIIKFIYGIGIGVIGLQMLGGILFGFGEGFFSGIVALILSPLLSLIALTIFRAVLESWIATIKTAENTSEIVKLMRDNQASSDESYSDSP